jgi:hypothetical protein
MTLGKRLYFASGLVAVLAVAAVALLLSGTISNAIGDSEDPITGPAYDRAVEAALGHTGEGRVTDTEVGDEDSYYEVEVTLDDGSQVDVQLDKDFNVVSDKADSDTNEDNDGDD